MGILNQGMRHNFRCNNRMPQHGRSIEGGEGWTKPHLSQAQPLHSGWLPSTQWSQDDNEYDEDGYVIGVHTHNWHDEALNAAHWQEDRITYNSEFGGPWRNMVPIGGPNVPWLRYPIDRGNIMQPIYLDRDREAYAIQHPQRRNMFEDAERRGYDRAPHRYVTNQPIIASGPSFFPPSANIEQQYPSVFPEQLRATTRGKESFNRESSVTDSNVNAEDTVLIARSAQPTTSPMKRSRNVQYVYDPEEADRFARGEKPHRIECDNTGRPIEVGRAGSKFLEVLRLLCIVFLDVSIIKVGDQNVDDYASLREEVNSKFVYIGHEISDDGFKKAVSKCMKAERSRLHKLYLTRPDRECPPKEQPDVWDRLKTYWNSPEFGKLSKVGLVATKITTTSEDMLVNTLNLSALCILIFIL